MLSEFRAGQLRKFVQICALVIILPACSTQIGAFKTQKSVTVYRLAKPGAGLDWARNIMRRRTPSPKRLYTGEKQVTGKIFAVNNATTSCLPKALLMIMTQAADHFNGRALITSGHRDEEHNRRVGGVRRSMHLNCKAVDFSVSDTSPTRLAAWLKSRADRGGVGTYCGKSTVHLDLGPRRVWHRPCTRSARNVAAGRP